MTASAEGRDYSAYQPPITAADLDGLDFAFTKATNGTAIIDPNLGSNWAVLAAWGKPRGAYHEFVPSNSPAAQAAYFVAAVNACGLKAGDMLGAVASDYTGTTDAEILAFCNEVRALAGPHCPILPYTDLDVAKTLVTTSEAYPDLWVAWPSGTAPNPSQWAPAKWTTWRFWQRGTVSGVDADAFNGTAADLQAWIATYRPSPVPAQTGDDAMAVAIPPGTAGTDVGVSFDGTNQYKTVGFLGDPSRVGASKFEVRCAFHSGGKGSQFTVVTATMTPAEPKAVVDVPAGSDGVSFQRLDEAPAVLYPNFA
jgi:lysozyme